MSDPFWYSLFGFLGLIVVQVGLFFKAKLDRAEDARNVKIAAELQADKVETAVAKQADKVEAAVAKQEDVVKAAVNKQENVVKEAVADVATKATETVKAHVEENVAAMAEVRAALEINKVTAESVRALQETFRLHAIEDNKNMVEIRAGIADINLRLSRNDEKVAAIEDVVDDKGKIALMPPGPPEPLH